MLDPSQVSIHKEMPNLNQKQIHLCTVPKDSSARINVSLAAPSILPRVVKPFSIGCRLATVSIFVADFHHSTAITLGVWDSARLDDNA